MVGMQLRALGPSSSLDRAATERACPDRGAAAAACPGPSALALSWRAQRSGSSSARIALRFRSSAPGDRGALIAHPPLRHCPANRRRAARISNNFEKASST